MTGKEEKKRKAVSGCCVIKWILELFYWLAKICNTGEKWSHTEEKKKLHKWVLESSDTYWKKKNKTQLSASKNKAGKLSTGV